MVKLKNIEITQNDIDKFYNKLKPINDLNDCWETECAVNAYGYPCFILINSNTHVPANRFMYKIHHPEEDIENLLICHTCDNRWCVNPDHLFSGTHQDNATDKVNKERQARGETFKCSKLKDQDIINLINDIINGKFKHFTEISKYYNIKNTEVMQIVNGKCWKHITKDYDMKTIKNMIPKDNYKLSSDDILDIKQRLKNGETYRNISVRYNISTQYVSGIKLGKYCKN